MDRSAKGILDYCGVCHGEEGLLHASWFSYPVATALIVFYPAMQFSAPGDFTVCLACFGRWVEAREREAGQDG